MLEESNEFLQRIEAGENLPLITSCCPAWIQYCEKNHPELMKNISTCKSPMQMFSSVIKAKYATSSRRVVCVAVMPCTAKKFETKRENQSASGYPDVDYSLTTRELGRMIESAGIFFKHLPDEEFDNPLGDSTGAAVIFGATGGVMEAALRTAAEVILGTKLEKLDFDDVRGTAPIKTATYKLGDTEVRVAVASGTKNARELLNKVKAGELEVDFIEIMACPGGCVNGGGQPVTIENAKKVRADGLYSADMTNTLKTSDTNPLMDKLYADYVKGRNHEMLHVHYKHN